jgi:two-component system cell cycle response regulator
MMPGMDGFEVCQRIKSDPATMHIPVVMVTALSDVADRIRGLEAGADDFLTKPINDIALFARVRSLVRLKMMVDQWRLRENTRGSLGVLQSISLVNAMSAEQANILVVEDSVVDASKISDVLVQDKNSVTVVNNNAAALQSALAKNFDLMIVSLSLAKEDGLRLVAQLRANEVTRQTPLLLIADDGDLPRAAKGLELGANDYALRPIERNELLARARTQIRRKRYQDRLRDNYEASLEMALTDSLTGLFNRRYLMVHIERQLARIAETKKPVATLILDIDHFKAVNDTYGHDAGDQVLREVAARTSRNLRNFDLVARYGGEEFVVILPDTDEDVAIIVAERLRQSIAAQPVAVAGLDKPINVTTSIGVTLSGTSKELATDVLKRADEALYRAKREGRNRVVLNAAQDVRAHIAASAVQLLHRAV